MGSTLLFPTSLLNRIAIEFHWRGLHVLNSLLRELEKLDSLKPEMVKVVLK